MNFPIQNTRELIIGLYQDVSWCNTGCTVCVAGTTTPCPAGQTQCPRSYEDLAYGISANQGGGSSFNDDKKARQFETYNCKFCNGEVHIVRSTNNASSLQSSYLASQYTQSSWISQSTIQTIACNDCRSGCFDTCYGGCFSVCANRNSGCSQGF